MTPTFETWKRLPTLPGGHRFMSLAQTDIFMETLFTQVCVPVYIENVRQLRVDLEAIVEQFSFVDKFKLGNWTREKTDAHLREWCEIRRIPPHVEQRLTVDLQRCHRENKTRVIPCPALERPIFDVIPALCVTTWPGFEEKWGLYYRAVELGLRLK